MSANVCGNCGNFKPQAGSRFFNCTKAQQAGARYGMQVRADTGACDAFVSSKDPAARPTTPPKAQQPSRDDRQPARLCPWVKIVLLVVLVVLIILLSWLIYTCLSGGLSNPPPSTTPTPTATSGPGTTASPPAPGGTPGAPTPRPTPTPVPTPAPFLGQDLLVGEWGRTAQEAVVVARAYRSGNHPGSIGGWGAPAGTEYVVAEITVLNTGAYAFQVYAGDFSIFDSYGAKYTGIAYKATGGLRVNASLDPGKSRGDKVFFNVPKGSTDLMIYHLMEGGVWARWHVP